MSGSTAGWRGGSACRPRRCAALCEAGEVRIRGKRCSPLRRLYGGEEIEVVRPAPLAARPAPEARRWPSRASPCSTTTRPASSSTSRPISRWSRPARPPPRWSARPRALGRFEVAGQALPGLPHRLDRDTTGCLLLARTDAALAALKAAFQAGEVEKRYLALVRGAPPDEGRCDTPYGRDPSDPRRFTTRVSSPRRARLSFRVVRRLRGAALLEVALETGRTHQIRVQLAEAGWPVLGDATYGEPTWIDRAVKETIDLGTGRAGAEDAGAGIGPGRQALHAVRLAFPSPEVGPGGGGGAAPTRPHGGPRQALVREAADGGARRAG